LLQESAEERAVRITGLVCHPHPLYGGTLHNKVVHKTASVLHQLGCVPLRFNFRGVGKSAGRHDAGRGEVEDARSALRWLEARYPGARRWLAGFSFGSWIAARLAAAEPVIERVVLIAPPVERSDFGVLRSAAVPKLVIQGTGDTICNPAALDAEFARWAEPKRLVHVEGAGHFFDRHLSTLAGVLVSELTPWLEERR
jgi:alpha/beta superfamily hydrolase